MNSKLFKGINKCVNQTRHKHNSCKILIVGGGTGGCAVAAKLARDYKKNEIIVVDPNENHYYQPMFTLVGGGITTLAETTKLTKDVLPTDAYWIKNEIVEFDAKNNKATVANGDTIEYDFMVVAMGLQTNYDQIPGLQEGLNSEGVCSNYSPKYVEKTFNEFKHFKSGNAIFTYPNTPVKCPGAPQKICYLADHYFRKNGKREKANLMYNTSLGVLFGVKTYADALWKVCKEHDIKVNLRTNLVEVRPDRKEAVFVNLDKETEKTVVPYSLLHVTPPMGAPKALKANKHLTNAGGLLEINQKTLQHVRYPNIFGIGDCTSTPNSKTAAAAAAQCKVVYDNITSAIKGHIPIAEYDGYASCPLITSYDKCILAEFDYSLTPLETFPFRQDIERFSMFLLKKSIMPPLYWNFMMNGHWNGPKAMRKLLHFDFKQTPNK